nr:MAG TPA: hypothetical protein [Caudoviricetes sp.]
MRKEITSAWCNPVFVLCFLCGEPVLMTVDVISVQKYKYFLK